MKLERGTQIRYVPNHASGVEDDLRCEDGFVTTDKGDSVFCRFWSRTNIGQLRTKSCSELTPAQNIVVHKSTTEKKVKEALEKYC